MKIAEPGQRALAAILGLLAIIPASGNASSVFGDWEVHAQQGGGCLLAQTVLGRRTGAPLVRALIQPQGAGGAIMLLRVPTGAFLPDGIAYRHRESDRVAIGLEWQSCDAEFCTALAVVSADEAARLKAGRDITVGYRPLAGSPVLNVPVSLTGLTRAWKEAEACP